MGHFTSPVLLKEGKKGIGSSTNSPLLETQLSNNVSCETVGTFCRSWQREGELFGKASWPKDGLHIFLEVQSRHSHSTDRALGSRWLMFLFLPSTGFADTADNTWRGYEQ